MKQALLFLLLFGFVSVKAQTYKYISVGDGLSDRRVYCIQKDKRRYMWFLTHEGIDRYNGTEFKQYPLAENGRTLKTNQHLGWLYVDKDDEIWEIGRSGMVFKYDEIKDRFQLTFKIPEQKAKYSPFTPISYSFIDNRQYVWLCGMDEIYLYHIEKKDTLTMVNVLGEPITNIAQQDSTHFFIGTEEGVQYAGLTAGGLKLIPLKGLSEFTVQVNDMYYHPATRQLFIGTFQKGIYIYNLDEDSCSPPQIDFSEVSVNRIKPFENNDILIATDGAGIYKINAVTRKTEP
ncbi:hypothetical protein EZS27_034660, partial [termite gut metagenome]